jgi:hypothetical protein
MNLHKKRIAQVSLWRCSPHLPWAILRWGCLPLELLWRRKTTIVEMKYGHEKGLVYGQETTVPAFPKRRMLGEIMSRSDSLTSGWRQSSTIYCWCQWVNTGMAIFHSTEGNRECWRSPSGYGAMMATIFVDCEAIHFDLPFHLEVKTLLCHTPSSQRDCLPFWGGRKVNVAWNRVQRR